MNIPVSFELAELLKEKGFNKRSEPYRYNKNGEITFLEGINAPVISEVVMWLYEKHKIWIAVSCYPKNKLIVWDYCIKLVDYVDFLDVLDVEDARTSPTEAYESAIKYALERLI